MLLKENYIEQDTFEDGPTPV